MIRPIIKLFDPLLKKVSSPIERVDSEILRLAGDMLETMYDANGIGLAAVQIGIPKRIFVLDVSDDSQEPSPQIFINPQIVFFSDTRSSMSEGCLSIPNVLAEVERPSEVVIRYIDREGKEQESSAKGLFATCLQHEMDHLDGRLFIDHLSRIKRMMVIKRYEKLIKQKSL